MHPEDRKRVKIQAQTGGKQLPNEVCLGLEPPELRKEEGRIAGAQPIESTKTGSSGLTETKVATMEPAWICARFPLHKLCGCLAWGFYWTPNRGCRVIFDPLDAWWYCGWWNGGGRMGIPQSLLFTLATVVAVVWHEAKVRKR